MKFIAWLAASCAWPSFIVIANISVQEDDDDDLTLLQLTHKKAVAEPSLDEPFVMEDLLPLTGAIVLGTGSEIAPGVLMPLLNLGNYNLSSNSSLWLELGGRGLDTAFSYHDGSLAELGAAVRTSRIPRSEIFVTLKIPCTRGSYVADPDAHIAHSFEVMGLDYVDLMLMHWTCTDGPEATAAVWKAMESLVADGRARAIGVSNFDSQDIDTLLEVATIKPAVNQCEFRIGNHDDATFQHCQELNITYSAYSPLGGLSGVDILHHPDVVQVAEAHAKSTAQVALRWVVQQGVVTVSASTKSSHILSDLEIFDFELSSEEMSLLTAVGFVEEDEEDTGS